MFDYYGLMKAKAAEAMLDAIYVIEEYYAQDGLDVSGWRLDEDSEEITDLRANLEVRYDSATIYSEDPYYYNTGGDASARVAGHEDKAVKLLWNVQESPRNVKSWFPPLSDDWTESRIELMDYMLMYDSVREGWEDCWAEIYNCRTLNELEAKMREIINSEPDEPEEAVIDMKAVKALEDWDR